MPVFKQWVLAKPNNDSNSSNQILANSKCSKSKKKLLKRLSNQRIKYYDYDSIMVMVLIIFVLGTYHSEDSFDLNEDHTPELAKGEILCRALFLSVDPITSLYMKYGMSFGETFPGRQVARIVESRNKDFLKGKVVSNLDGKSDGQTKTY